MKIACKIYVFVFVRQHILQTYRHNCDHYNLSQLSRGFEGAKYNLKSGNRGQFINELWIVLSKKELYCRIYTIVVVAISEKW